jgi:hypothetical protein
MATFEARLRAAQTRQAAGLGGPRELSDYAVAQSATERAEIASALEALLPDVTEEYLAPDGHRSQAIDMPGHNPKNPEHQKFQREWQEYHESERHFIADNPGADARLQGVKLPQSVVVFAIKNRNPQILFYLSHPKNRQFANELAQLPAHDLQGELEQLAAILLNDERVPVEERGVIRRGDLQVDTYLKSRHSGSETRKPLPRSREDMNVDDFLRMRKGERRELRRIKGHR